MVKMNLINLYGPPGSGKTTIMHGLTYELKTMGLSTENTPEFIKEMIFEGSDPEIFGGQIFILGQQNRRISRLLRTADFIITDCPLILIASYTPPNYIKGFEEMAINLANSYNNVNFFLHRNKEYDFELANRYHDSESSDQKSVEIQDYLKKHDVKYKELTSGDHVISEIIDSLIESNIITTDHIRKSRNPKIRKKFGV